MSTSKTFGCLTSQGGACAGLFDAALGLLEAWASTHAVTPSTTGSVEEIPKWAEALLLSLDIGMQPQPRALEPAAAATAAQAATGAAPNSTAAPTAAAAGEGTAAASASATPSGSVPAAASADAQPSTGVDAKQEPAASPSKDMLDQQNMERLKQTIRSMYLPHGQLSDKQLERTADVGMRLLQHLLVWGSVWKAPEKSDQAEAPDPASAAQATLQVLARVTKGHKLALKVCTQKSRAFCLGFCWALDIMYVNSLFNAHVLSATLHVRMSL